MKRASLFITFLLLGAATARAHEVHHSIEGTQAAIISLSYANGEPFAYEKYALTPAGQDTPQQVGNTDAQGRIAFVPGNVEKWRLQATSADGHGVNLEFAAPTLAAAPAATEPATPRWLLAGFGLSLVFGVFGLVQLFARKKP